ARPLAAHPRHADPGASRPARHPASGVRREEVAGAQHRAVGADPGDDRADAPRRPGRGAGAGGRWAGGGARRHHRRGRPRGARVPARPRRLPVDAGVQGLPEVLLHQPQRGHLPRHPRLHGDRRRRHRQHRRHRVRGRRARRHQRDVPRRRRGRGVAAARRAHPRGHRPRDPGGAPGSAAQRRGPRDRVLRPPLRLRRGARLHRPRHRPQLPLRPGGAALRRPVRRDGPRAGHDLHDRADDHPRLHRLRHLGRRVDRRHEGPIPHRPVRAHRARHRRRRRGAHPAL
ncbi:MAG: Methionine aminopeptidase, partial [uncultured Pseudonocardia sp.]